MSPRDWRINTGKSLAQMAKRVGIKGKNPSATYRRYELGISACPARIMLAVCEDSNGAVRLQDWAAVLASASPAAFTGSASDTMEKEVV